MQSDKRDFKGVWISKELYLDKNLSWIEKILLVEIDSLDNSEMGCFASNAYLAEFLNVSEGRCANMISDLKKRSYLYQSFFDGRVRGLKLCKINKNDVTENGNINHVNNAKNESSFHENDKAAFTKTLKLTSRKREHINTVYKYNDNTNNNTLQNFSNFADLENEKIVKSKKTTHDTDKFESKKFATIFDTEYQKIFDDSFVFQSRDFKALKELIENLKKSCEKKNQKIAFDLGAEVQSVTENDLENTFVFFLTEIAKDGFSRKNYFTPVKMQNNYQLLINKIKENANNTKPNGTPDRFAEVKNAFAEHLASKNFNTDGSSS